jgi:hypothetical protein
MAHGVMACIWLNNNMAMTPRSMHLAELIPKLPPACAYILDPGPLAGVQVGKLEMSLQEARCRQQEQQEQHELWRRSGPRQLLLHHHQQWPGPVAGAGASSSVAAAQLQCACVLDDVCSSMRLDCGSAAAAAATGLAVGDAGDASGAAAEAAAGAGSGISSSTDGSSFQAGQQEAGVGVGCDSVPGSSRNAGSGAGNSTGSSTGDCSVGGRAAVVNFWWPRWLHDDVDSMGRMVDPAELEMWEEEGGEGVEQVGGSRSYTSSCTAG